MHTLLIALTLATPLAQAEDAPEYLLGDLGVRIDLPAGWEMTRWSDWDLKAEQKTARETVLLFVWATPVQVPITSADGWGTVYEAKIDELKGDSPAVAGGRVEELGGRQVALIDAAFRFGKGGPPGIMRGATLEVAGQNMHLAFVAPKGSARAADRQRSRVVGTLDFHTEPEKVAFGGTVDALGITTKLPADWREPLASELPQVNPALDKLGIEDLTPCYTAIRPRAGSEPDVLATCQGGLLLGVVDEYSFEATDAVVRERMFGGADIAAAEQVDLGDRVGFLYTLRDDLAVGVVPYADGIARTWVVGSGGGLDDAARAALQGSTWSGPHPAGIGDQVAYWVTHRPTSPVVLCPVLGLVVVAGALAVGGVAMTRRSRTGYDDLDD